jgi:hypothetical protein
LYFFSIAVILLLIVVAIISCKNKQLKIKLQSEVREVINRQSIDNDEEVMRYNKIGGSNDRIKNNNNSIGDTDES